MVKHFFRFVDDLKNTFYISAATTATAQQKNVTSPASGNDGTSFFF